MPHRRRTMGHTSVPRGQRVIIWFHDGTTTTDRFLEKKDRYLLFARLGKIPRKDVANLSFLKGAKRGRRPEGDGLCPPAT